MKTLSITILLTFFYHSTQPMHIALSPVEQEIEECIARSNLDYLEKVLTQYTPGVNHTFLLETALAKTKTDLIIKNKPYNEYRIGSFVASGMTCAISLITLYLSSTLNPSSYGTAELGYVAAGFMGWESFKQLTRGINNIWAEERYRDALAVYGKLSSYDKSLKTDDNA